MHHLLGRQRRLTVLALLRLNVLFALIFQKAEIFVGFLESVMISIESMNHIVAIHIYLVFHVDNLFNELYEFLHFLAE